MNLRNYQTLPNAILQERVKITYGWHFLERRLDFHVEICFLLASIFFSSHYIIKNLHISPIVGFQLKGQFTVLAHTNSDH